MTFVSDRGGDFDLYLMKANSKDLYRILDTNTIVAHPDIWVYLKARKSAIIPGRTASLIVYYGNRGALVTENTVVEIELPSDATLESAVFHFAERFDFLSPSTILSIYFINT